MDSFTPMGRFQFPFQRPLSCLYNDTKRSSDFVKEPIQNEEDPDMKALHRKLRIQKDRLVSWGLEWSDPIQSTEIDESLSKAGLSEVVGSIMSTIKDILDEAEPLWQRSRHVISLSRESPDKKTPRVQWHQGRFEDLIRDLTASIDTLYDLSRTRPYGHFTRQMWKTTYKSPNADEFRQFESSRMQTPQLIDVTTLTFLRSMCLESSGSAMRQIVFMSNTAYSKLTTRGTKSQAPWTPLLLEYATFDSIYSATGIMPPMSRFETLSSGLQQDPQLAPGTWTGLPRLLGYFEDMEKSRIGLVYRLPPSFNVVQTNPTTISRKHNLKTLQDLVCYHDEPPLEDKFRLAYNLTNTIFDMHARGLTHGNLAAMNISFGYAANKGPRGEFNFIIDVRRPLVSSFDIFPEDGATSQSSLWRHPLDPHNSRKSAVRRASDERVLEMYSLAIALWSIGLWTKIEALPFDFDSDSTSTFVSGAALDFLAAKCGTLYMKAFQVCWHAVDDELSAHCGVEDFLSMVRAQTTRCLETCCILDGVGGLKNRLDQELRIVDATQDRAETSKGAKSSSGHPADKKAPSPQSDSDPRLSERMEPVDPDTDENAARQKMRLYPHVPLPPDVVDKWNTILMPQINQALRNFYRKHPESVEISLESVGTSPQATQPTVLVVCTSVGKVRAILKKRLGELFDGTTGFALKVCRGHVLRSRHFSKSVLPSMARTNVADSDQGLEKGAVNPEYQECPGNGASIGAWIGDRHLPPVSFGGLVLVDDRLYGMTVHHMLDDPDREQAQMETQCSSAVSGHDWYTDFMEGSGYEDFAYELSDTESGPYSETDITSDYGDEEEGDDDDDDDDDDKDDKGDKDEDGFEPGDIPGIEPGCGDGYVVTQPALDDVEEGFYPCAETEDEDHLDTFSLGEVYASSGIRRKQAYGLTHEVDWALFKFANGRRPGENAIPRCEDGKSILDWNEDVAKLRPTTVAPSSSLPGMEVQCIARTSGLQSGQILSTLTSVKIYGRCSPSHTYQVASAPTVGERESKSGLPMGIPGDSGAWVVDRRHGQLCGHILAWSQRKRVAYICPMDVLLLDVAQTLEASEVRLPGGEPVITLGDPSQDQGVNCSRKAEDDDNGESRDLGEDEDEDGEAPSLAGVPKCARQISTESSPTSARGSSSQGSSSPPRLEASGDLRVLTRRLEDLDMSQTQRIGVGG
ncbi:hypothetical protein NOR_00735 [Metarhizium rileyi]|uniref:HET-s/LopB domain protein n=1 Tax=Metarhizium rileyi (strain RCEF 4871) TaxID=1649241 RepID=A0A162HZJ8_METRR|nr:hypothetical protein NOR_00735 [Metarhizium rileyi RCEF 4871]